MKLIKKKMTLEEYKKKYPHYRGNLLSFSDKEIKDINSDFRKYNENKENIDLDKYFLLKNRKWVHIDGRYYQVPGFSLTGFKSLNGAAKVGLSLGGAAVIAAAVVTPFFIPKASSGSITKESFVKNLSYLAEQNENRKFQLTGTTKFVLEEYEPDPTTIKEFIVDGYNEKVVSSYEDEEGIEHEYTEYVHSTGKNGDIFTYDSDYERWEYANQSQFYSTEYCISLGIYSEHTDAFTFEGKKAKVDSLSVKDVIIPGMEEEGTFDVTIKNTTITFNENNIIDKIHEEVTFSADEPISDEEFYTFTLINDFTYSKVGNAKVILPNEDFPISPEYDGVGYVGFDDDGNITTKKSNTEYYKIYCTAENRSNWSPEDGKLIIPSEYKGQDVKGVYYDGEKGGFEGCTKLTTVITETSTFELEDNAFKDCPNLVKFITEDEEETAEDGVFDFAYVNYIGKNAFTGSTDYIETLHFNKSDVFDFKVDCTAFGTNYTEEQSKIFYKSETNNGYYIRNYSRSSNYSEPFILVSGSIDANGKLDLSDVTTSYDLLIANNAYNGNSNLVDIANFGNAVSIGDGSFNGCINLATVAWSNNITRIGKSAFAGTDLSELNLRQAINLTQIDSMAFYNCDKITEVTMPLGIKKIGNYAFGNDVIELTTANFVSNVEYEIYEGDDTYGEYEKIIPSAEKTKAIEFLTGNYNWHINSSSPSDSFVLSETERCYICGSSTKGINLYDGYTTINVSISTLSGEVVPIKGFRIYYQDGQLVNPSNYANFGFIVNGVALDESDFTIDSEKITLNTSVATADDNIKFYIFNNNMDYYTEYIIKSFGE